MGSCEYSMLDLPSSGDSIQVAKEPANYNINNKVSTHLIEGSRDSGFLYEVAWFTSNRMNQVSCATHQYDPKLMNKLITLCRHIDAAG